MHSPAISDERDGWLRTEPLQLRSDVEFITGAGGRPMLVSPHGKFLTISPSGVTIIRRLDRPTTGQALITTLLAEHPEQETSIRTVLPVFLTDLRRASLLTIDPEPPSRSWTDTFTRWGKLDPVKRFPLIRDPNRFSSPVSRLVARVPVPLLYAALVLLPLTSIALLGPALRVPPVFVLVIGMAHRYVFALTTAVDEMFTARKARSIGPRGGARADRAFVAASAGALFGKAHALSEDVHQAMVARAYRGTPRTLSRTRLNSADLAWVGVCAATAILAVMGDRALGA